MAWNESNNKGNDPWGGRNKPQGPPDLDALLRKFKNKLLASLKGNKASNSSGSGTSFKPDRVASWMIGLVVFAIIIIWLLSGIFIVSPNERGVITRFGKYVETVMPGPHWIPRFISSDYIVDTRTASFSYQSDMLTKDENIVSVAVSVQYRIDNVRDYLFNVVNPDTSLQQATASALRQVVGHTTLDEVLTTGRQLVRDQVSQQLQDILNRYKSGLVVTDITLQSVKPPEAVTAAFDDAIKAREDQQSYINQANAYVNQVSAVAQGQAARILQEAQAYKQEVVLDAQADTAGYLALLPEYVKAPQVTRERLYLSTIESLLAKNTKVLVDDKGGNNMLYLPLDKLMHEQAITNSSDDKTANPIAPVATTVLSKDALSTENLILNRPAYPTTRGSY